MNTDHPYRPNEAEQRVRGAAPIFLSRLRKLHPISLKEIQAMPIHYDIETDDLFLAGLEKGLEKGVEKQQYDTVVRMIKTGRFQDEEIAGIAGVTLSFVRKTRKELKA